MSFSPDGKTLASASLTVKMSFVGCGHDSGILKYTSGFPHIASFADVMRNINKITMWWSFSPDGSDTRQCEWINGHWQNNFRCCDVNSGIHQMTANSLSVQVIANSDYHGSLYADRGSTSRQWRSGQKTSFVGTLYTWNTQSHSFKGMEELGSIAYHLVPMERRSPVRVRTELFV